MLKFPSKEVIDRLPKMVEEDFRRDGEVFLKIVKWSNGDATVKFRAVPREEIRTALKAAGFRYSGGFWDGKADAIPAMIAELPKTTEDEIFKSEVAALTAKAR